MTVGVHVSLRACVYVCVGCVAVCEWQRVLNMCWRSQRNSRALIRTSPGWQLVNSVLRIGVFYSGTKECKLVPMPSGHWEPIHMARTLTLKRELRVALQCNFPQSKEKQAGLMTRPTRTSVLFVCERESVCVRVSLSTCGHQGSFSAVTKKQKSLVEFSRAQTSCTHTEPCVQSKHFILKLHLRAKNGVPTGDLIALVLSFSAFMLLFFPPPQQCWDSR